MKNRSISLQPRVRSIPTLHESVELKIFNLTSSVAHMEKQVLPLSKENGTLKTTIQVLNNEIQDNLEQLLCYLGEEQQLQAKVSDIKSVVVLIRDQMQQHIDTIITQQTRLSCAETIHTQLLQSINELKQQHTVELLKIQEQRNQEVIKYEQQTIELEGTINNQLKHVEQLNHQLSKQFEHMEIMKSTVRSQYQDEIHNLQSTIKCMEVDVIKLNEQHQLDLDKLTYQFEKEKKYLKDALDECQSKVESKYRKIHLDNQNLIESVQIHTKTINQLKTQKESIDKQLNTIKLQNEQLAKELIEEKRNRAKENKTYIEQANQNAEFTIKIANYDKMLIKHKEQHLLSEKQIRLINIQKNTETTKLKGEITQLQAQIADLFLQQQRRDIGHQEQLQIQKRKLLLHFGQKVEETEEQEGFMMMDQETQYESPEMKEYIANMELNCTMLQKENSGLNQKLKDCEQISQLEQESITRRFNQQIEENGIKYKQQMQKQQQDSEYQRQQQLADFNNRLGLMNNQFSYQMDLVQTELKQAQQTIIYRDESISEQKQELEEALEQIDDLKYQAIILQEQHNKKIDQINSNIIQMQVDEQQREAVLRQEMKVKDYQIQDLEQSIKDTEKAKQLVFRQLQDCNKELNQEKQQVQNSKKQLEQKMKDMMQLQEQISGLNEKIRLMTLETENAKQTFNIFRRNTTQTTKTTRTNASERDDITNYIKQIKYNQSDHKVSVTSQIQSRNIRLITPEKRIRSISQSRSLLRVIKE